MRISFLVALTGKGVKGNKMGCRGRCKEIYPPPPIKHEREVSGLFLFQIIDLIILMINDLRSPSSPIIL